MRLAARLNLLVSLGSLVVLVMILRQLDRVVPPEHILPALRNALSLTPTAIPEPSTYALAGILALGAIVTLRLTRK